MSTSFQQQSPDQTLNRFKTKAKPQHGQKPTPGVIPPEVRSFEPMPGRS